MLNHNMYFTISSEGMYVAWMNDQMLAVSNNKFDCAKKAADNLVKILDDVMQTLEQERANK